MCREHYKMASFQQLKLKCMKCQNQTNDSKVFACDHWFCRDCTLTCYIDFLETMRERGQEPPPESFPCHVCHEMTAVPPGGPCMLPAPDQATVDKITQDVETVSVSTPGLQESIDPTPAPDPATVDEMTQDVETVSVSTPGLQDITQNVQTVSVSTPGLQESIDPTPAPPSATEQPLMAGITQLTACELLWEKNVSSGQNDIRIRSIDFFLDGAMWFISSKEVDDPSGTNAIQSTKIECLGLDGERAEMPFHCSFTLPLRISVRHEDKTVAIYCFEGKHIVYIYTKTQGWDCTSYTVDTLLQEMALASGGQLVGIQIVNNEYRVMKFQSSGEKQWSVKIAPHSKSAPKVKVDKRDRVIINLVTERRITIYSPDGDLLINIPQVFVKQPAGICTDSQGNIYIGDRSDYTIHQFNADGRFLQTVVKSKIYPANLAMYDDSYLAVSSYNTRNVALYKIN